jgi:hypothetical protein
MSNTPHDKIFKSAFQTPAHMEDVLRTVLPSKLAEHIRWGTLFISSPAHGSTPF